MRCTQVHLIISLLLEMISHNRKYSLVFLKEIAYLIRLWPWILSWYQWSLPATVKGHSRVDLKKIKAPASSIAYGRQVPHLHWKFWESPGNWQHLSDTRRCSGNLTFCYHPPLPEAPPASWSTNFPLPGINMAKVRCLCIFWILIWLAWCWHVFQHYGGGWYYPFNKGPVIGE